MLVTYKFLKQITLIEGINMWLTQEWAQTFFKQLDIINWNLPKELITNHNPTFFSKFWATLFFKLEIKLLYNTIYHLQTDGLSKRKNQIMGIAFCFFMQALENLSYWPKVLFYIQLILNNTFSLTKKKRSNKMAYESFLYWPLDFLFFPAIFNTYKAYTNMIDIILFKLTNQKVHYNWKHQFLFMKVRD